MPATREDTNEPSVRREVISCWDVLCMSFSQLGESFLYRRLRFKIVIIIRRGTNVNPVTELTFWIFVAEYFEEPRHGL